MIKLNTYITEKLHINKDINVVINRNVLVIPFGNYFDKFISINKIISLYVSYKIHSFNAFIVSLKFINDNINKRDILKWEEVKGTSNCVMIYEIPDKYNNMKKFAQDIESNKIKIYDLEYYEP